jgi:hypothetical protein
VVVHLGAGEWLVVDSCISRRTNRPAALEYLEELSVNIARDVKVVVVSHWHADHFRGASEVLDAATSSIFACSACLRASDDFWRMVASPRIVGPDFEDQSEFTRIFEILEQRRPPGARPGSGGPRWARSDMVVAQISGRLPCDYAVHALSPSDAAITLGFRELAETFFRRGEVRRRAVALSPNQVAVALWIVVGEMRVLLGADLEESGSPTLGWKAVLGSPGKPLGQARIFKVPHHGSRNADNADVWSQMLDKQPTALLTPYNTGRTPLPRPEDVERLKRRTPDLYWTSRPGGWSPPSRGPL